MITLLLGRKLLLATIDDIDADLADISWFTVDGYVVRNNSNAPPVRINLHRIIMERMIGRALATDELVDHKDRNPLNCTRNNLRLSNKSTNGQNRPASRNSRSGYKGVSWFKPARKWRATIGISGKHINIGYFNNLRDAVIAYNLAAQEHFGEFAYLNPVPPMATPFCADAQKDVDL